MNCHVRIIAEAEGEFAGECWVELDAVQPSTAGCQQSRYRAVAGADFNDCALGHIAERACDAQARIFVDEEVLAELGFLRHAMMMLAGLPQSSCEPMSENPDMGHPAQRRD